MTRVIDKLYHTICSVAHGLIDSEDDGNSSAKANQELIEIAKGVLEGGLAADSIRVTKATRHLIQESCGELDLRDLVDDASDNEDEDEDEAPDVPEAQIIYNDDDRTKFALDVL